MGGLRFDKFAQGLSSTIGQGIALGRQVKDNREEKREKGIDKEIAEIMSGAPGGEVTADATLMGQNTPETQAWNARTDALDPKTATPADLQQIPMSVRYASDGKNQIARVDDLLKERYGAYTPEYMAARGAYRDELQSLQADLMAQAKNALSTGDKKTAAELMTRAYSMFPNGKGIDIKEKNGKLYGIGFDMKTLKPDGSMEITPEAIDMAAREMADKEKFDTYLHKEHKERREAAAEKRAEGAYGWERKQDDARMTLLENQAAMAELQTKIAKNPEYGLEAQTLEKIKGLRQDRLKAYAQSFEATAKGHYYLEGGASRGQARYPGGMKASDWDRRVNMLTAELKDYTAAKIGIPDADYEILFIDNGDLLNQYMMLEFKKSMVMGEVFDPGKSVV